MWKHVERHDDARDGEREKERDMQEELRDLNIISFIITHSERKTKRRAICF